MSINILSVTDAGCDLTLVDLSDRDLMYLTQTDEDGKEHFVFLSPKMVAQLLPEIKTWMHLTIPQD